jgi:hypothetical protein
MANKDDKMAFNENYYGKISLMNRLALLLQRKKIENRILTH